MATPKRSRSDRIARKGSPSDPEAIESQGRRDKFEAELLRFGTTLRYDRQVDSDLIAKCECDTIGVRFTTAALRPVIRSPHKDIHISASARAITIDVRVARAAVELALKWPTLMSAVTISFSDSSRDYCYDSPSRLLISVLLLLLLHPPRTAMGAPTAPEADAVTNLPSCK